MFCAQRKWATAELLASIRASRYESSVFLCPHLMKSAIPLGMRGGGAAQRRKNGVREKDREGERWTWRMKTWR